MPISAAAARLNPFVHVDADRIYNPLTDRVLLPGDPDYASLRAFAENEGVAPPTSAARLEEEGWIIRADIDPSRQYRLKIVSLETTSGCNQKCYFCPVSIAPREDYEMPVALFERIVGELSGFRDTLESVFLQSYNEPSAGRRFVDECRTLAAADLPIAVLSNGSGLTPQKVQSLIELGGLRYLCINLSTLDRERYARDRGADHLPIVLKNIDAMKDLDVARQMRIVVLGTGDDVHQRDFEQITERFAGSRFEVERHEVMDRAGWLDVGLKQSEVKKHLRGCDNLGSRPLQHLHITPRGTCVLCCEDYDERYVVGDLMQNTIAEVLEGDEVARLRRWVYGLDEAPADFICRNCVFAR
jgi:MoaA/NifB/PqqE/SkfB family radical SAM enzyme